MHLIPPQAYLMKHPLRPKLPQQGGSLIEVLVSLLLVAFGFLGIGALFNFSISANKSASSRLVATMLAQDYADLTRANVGGFQANNYNRAISSFDPAAKTVATPDTSKTCPNYDSSPCATAARSAQNDQALFQARVRALLPAGDFAANRVAAGNTDAMDLWILWVEGKNVDDPNAVNDVCPTTVVNQNPVPDPFPRCLYVRIAL